MRVGCDRRLSGGKRARRQGSKEGKSKHAPFAKPTKGCGRLRVGRGGWSVEGRKFKVEKAKPAPFAKPAKGCGTHRDNARRNCQHSVELSACELKGRPPVKLWGQIRCGITSLCHEGWPTRPARRKGCPPATVRNHQPAPEWLRHPPGHARPLGRVHRLFETKTGFLLNFLFYLCIAGKRVKEVGQICFFAIFGPSQFRSL